MTTSMARMEANRRNSQRSTGPKTAEGKAASRLNAWQHGMAGRGDLVGPGDDGIVVAARTEAFARELAAVGAMGQLLAHRAAVLSVRMESLAQGEMIAVQAAEGCGRAEFDADRVAAIDELLAEAATPGGDPAAALGALAECPDGLERLVAAWRDLADQLRAAGPGGAVEQAARWLGLTIDPAGAAPPPEKLIGLVEVELGRLRDVLGTMADATRAIEEARRAAGLAARFDPSPEAELARRYEAAAERGLYRAIRTIATLNEQAGRTGAESNLAAGWAAVGSSGMAPPRLDPIPSPPSRPAPSVPVAPLKPLASFRAGGLDALASFRVGVTSVAGPRPAGPIGSAITPDPRTEARPQRPDLRKLDQKLAGKRR